MFGTMRVAAAMAALMSNRNPTMERPDTIIIGPASGGKTTAKAIAEIQHAISNRKIPALAAMDHRSPRNKPIFEGGKQRVSLKTMSNRQRALYEKSLRRTARHNKEA